MISNDFYRLAATRSGGGQFVEDSQSDSNLNECENGPSTSKTEEYAGPKVVKTTENIPKWFKPSK